MSKKENKKKLPEKVTPKRAVTSKLIKKEKNPLIAFQYDEKRIDLLFGEIMEEYIIEGEFIKAAANVQRKHNYKVPISVFKLICDRITTHAKLVCEDMFEQVLFKHSIIYNQISRYSKSIGFGPGVTRAMSQKEKLLGLSDEGLDTLVIDNEMTIVMGESYDFNLLNEQEKLELEQLVIKCKPLKQIAEKSSV